MPEPNHDTARVHNVDAELISGRFICSAGSFRRARPDQVVPRPNNLPIKRNRDLNTGHVGVPLRPSIAAMGFVALAAGLAWLHKRQWTFREAN